MRHSHEYRVSVLGHLPLHILIADRMVVTGTPIVIPTQPKWGVLFAILVSSGFVGQVRHLHSFSGRLDHLFFTRYCYQWVFSVKPQGEERLRYILK